MANHKENLVSRIELTDSTGAQSAKFFSGVRRRLTDVTDRVTQRESIVGRSRTKIITFTMTATCSPDKPRGCLSEACDAQLDCSDVGFSNIFRCRNCPHNR